MQVVSEEEWSEANWKQGHTYTTHKEAFRVINIFAKENCTISLILLWIFSILNGGEKKYPPSSFVLNCKG